MPLLNDFGHQLSAYADFSDPFFDRNSQAQQDQKSNSIFEPLTLLTSMTDYEVRNSI